MQEGVRSVDSRERSRGKRGRRRRRAEGAVPKNLIACNPEQGSQTSGGSRGTLLSRYFIRAEHQMEIAFK